MDIAHALADGVDFFYAFVHARLRAEHARVRLHGGANVIGDVLRVFAAAAVLQFGQTRQGVVGCIGWQGFVRVFAVELDDVVAR